MDNRFALIARQRSGTGFFSTVLNSHPSIHFFPEAFLGRDFKEPYSFFHYYNNVVRQNPGLIAFRERPGVINSFFDHLYTQNMYETCRNADADLSPKQLSHIGVDIKYTDLKDDAAILNILKSRNIRVIHLVRKNLLKLLISEVLNNNKVQLGRKSHMKETPPPVKVNLPTGAELIRKLDSFEIDIENVRKTIRQHFDSIEIYYEDLADTTHQNCSQIKPAALHQIYEFMGVGDRLMDLSTPLRKTNPDRLEDVIENYQEVRQTLTTNDFKYLQYLD